MTDFAEEYLAYLNFFQSILPPNIHVIQQSSYTYNRQAIQENVSYTTSRRIKQSERDIIEKISNESIHYLQTKSKELKAHLIEESKKLRQSLQHKYEIGDHLLTLPGLVKIELDQEDKNQSKTTACAFYPTQGMITLITLWSDRELQQFYPNLKHQRLLENNPNWKDKVKFIGIARLSLDSYSDVMEKMADNQIYENMYAFEKSGAHYHLHDQLNDRLLDRDNREIPPYFILLDHQAKIVYKGGPNYFDVEQSINALINGEFDLQKQQPNAQEQNNYQDIPYNLIEDLQNQLIKAQSEIDKMNQTIVETLYLKLIRQKQLGTNESTFSLVLENYNLYNQVDVEKLELAQQITSKLKDNFPWLDISKVQKSPKRFKDNLTQKIQELIQEHGVKVDRINIITQELEFDYEIKDTKLKVKEELTTFSEQYSFKIYITVEPLIKEFIEWREPADYRNNDYLEEQSDFLLKGVKAACALKRGDKFQTINDYLDLNTKKQVSIMSTPGQILIVCYQTDKQQLLEHQQFLMNQNWGNNVKFITLIYKDVELPSYLITNKQCQKYMDIYYTLEYNKIDLLQYGIKSKQTQYIVVDQAGLIVNTGKMDLKDLGIMVNNLIAQEQQKQIIQQVEQGPRVTAQQFEAVIQYVSKHTDLLSTMGPQSVFSFYIKQRNKFNSTTNQFLKYGKPKMNYKVYSNLFDQFKIFLDGIFTIIPKPYWKLNETVVQAFNIPFPGTECVLCQMKLSDQTPQYYSFNKNEFLCTECAETVDNTQGMPQYKYPDQLFFINAPLTDLSILNGIEEYKKGINKQFIDQYQKSTLSKKCFNCRSESLPLYKGIWPGKFGCDVILLNKRYSETYGYANREELNACQNCFFKLKEKNSVEYNNMIEIIAGDVKTKDILFRRDLSKDLY